MKEQVKFLEWYDAEKKKGLVAMDLFFTLPFEPGTTSEDVFRQINLANEMIASGQPVRRPDIF